jgi:hypothetical protein
MMRRLRFTLRLLMIAVAIIALTFGAEQMWRRREFLRSEAAAHALKEAFYSDLAQDLAGDPGQAASLTATALLPDGTAVRFKGHGATRRPFYPPDGSVPADAATVARLVAMCKQRAAHHSQLRRKYERAARNPWLGVPPNPRPPE